MLCPLPAWISGKRGRWQAGALGSSGAKCCTEEETEALRGDGFSVGTKWLAAGATTRRERPPGGSLCTVPGRWRTGTGRGLVWDALGAARCGKPGAPGPWQEAAPLPRVGISLVVRLWSW